MLFESSPLASTDVLQEDVSLAVIRHTLSEKAACVLQSARTAVSGVKETQLQDLKSIVKPAEMMLDVMAAILSLLGHREHSWHSIRKLLGRYELPSRLLALEPHQVPFESQLEVQQIVEQHADSFLVAEYVGHL